MLNLRDETLSQPLSLGQKKLSAQPKISRHRRSYMQCLRFIITFHFGKSLNNWRNNEQFPCYVQYAPPPLSLLSQKILSNVAQSVNRQTGYNVPHCLPYRSNFLLSLPLHPISPSTPPPSLTTPSLPLPSSTQPHVMGQQKYNCSPKKLAHTNGREHVKDKVLGTKYVR